MEKLINYLKNSESPYAAIILLIIGVERYSSEMNIELTSLSANHWFWIVITGVGVCIYAHHLENKVPKGETEKLKKLVLYLHSELKKMKQLSEGKS